MNDRELTEGKKAIFFVDDESAIHEQMAKTLAHLDADVVCFSDPAQCLKHIQVWDCRLLITDVRMKGMDGVLLMSKVKSIVPSLPVLVVTGYGDVPLAVNAMRAGATDFIEKPFKKERLLSAVTETLEKHPGPHIPLGMILTKTEKEVLKLMLQGRATREIAEIRHRARRTIEDHRSRILLKLGVRNLAELLRKLGGLGPDDVRQLL